MKLTQMTFGEALTEVGNQILTISLKLKVSNPVYAAIYARTGVSVSFRKVERLIDENCRILRSLVADYVSRRKSGEKKSTVQNSADLLSLFFESADVFTDETIIDELMDFFLAAASTTTSGSQAFTSHFSTAPESLEKARNEFN